MARYIDIEPLEKEGWYMARVYNDSLTSQTYETKKLKEIPTADVVEVVRCKDCAEWQTDWIPSCGANGGHYCATMDSMTKANDYCSYGERKSE